MGRPVIFYSKRDSNRRSERKENVPVARFSRGEPASGAPRRRGVRGLTGRKGEEKDS